MRRADEVVVLYGDCLKILEALTSRIPQECREYFVFTLKLVGLVYGINFTFSNNFVLILYVSIVRLNMKARNSNMKFIN